MLLPSLPLKTPARTSSFSLLLVLCLSLPQVTLFLAGTSRGDRLYTPSPCVSDIPFLNRPLQGPRTHLLQRRRVMTFVKCIAFGALVSLGLASANPQVWGGISYRNPVSAITYDNLGCTGTYQEVTGYDPKACTCTYSPKTYSGPLAPLNEGV